MSKYYAVKSGKEGPKIYDNWPDCKRNVDGFSGATYKAFRTLAEAGAFANLGTSENYVGNSNLDVTVKNTTKINDNPITKYDRIIVFTDGSCTNLATEQALAGSGIYFPQLGWEFSLPVPGIQTHNRGELYAVIRALELILELKPIVPVEIHIDATYVMDNIESNNKKNLDLWNRLHPLLAKVKVIWVKEAAHTGVHGNDRADALAKAITFAK